MGGIINFFKKLIGGIFGFIGGLFGGKKADSIASSVNSEVKAKKTKGFYLELDESKASTPAPAAATSTPAASAAAPTATEATAPKKGVKSKKTKASEEKAPAPAAPAANPLNLPQPTVTFAEASQTPQMVTPRRRPGANMSSYLTMAKSISKA